MTNRVSIAAVLVLTAAVLFVFAAGAGEREEADADARAVDAVLDRPWQEAVISVRDLDAASRLFRDVGGWEVVSRGAMRRSELDHWGLPDSAAGEYLLIRAPGSTFGHLRFVRFIGVEQTPVRVGARAWDTGGYFSLMLRARDLDRVYADALAIGWHSESEPVRFDFAPSVLANVVLKGPDGINVALYERLEPPLDAFWDFERLSQPFNAMQMVADIERADRFFHDGLGMTHFWSGDFLDPAPGPNNFGLPQNLVTEIPRRTRILEADPGSEIGRLELMQFAGLDGRDLSARADAPNLGILAVRYEVADIRALPARLADRGIDTLRGPHDVEIEAIGETTMVTVQAPDGALVQLYAPR